MAQKNIQSALHEKRLFPPSAQFRSRAGLKAGELKAMYAKAEEAAVVSEAHEIKGESVFAYVVLNISRPQGARAQSLIEELRSWVGEQLSPIAKPDEIRFELLRCGAAAPPAGNGKSGARRKPPAAKQRRAAVKSVRRPRGKS